MQASTYIKGPALIEGFTTITSSGGSTSLTANSETKQIVTGTLTHTINLPDATTLPLGRKFLIINRSSSDIDVKDASGNPLLTIVAGTQAETHLRAAGSAAGTWDLLESSSGGGGVSAWGDLTGFISNQTDLQTALDAKADENNPSFAGTIGTTLTASRLLTTDASSNLAASSVTSTEAGYLSGVTGGIQTQLDAKQLRSTLTTKGDIYVATASNTTTRQGVGTDGQSIIADSAATNGIRYKTPLVDNFIKNGDAESVTPIVTYADAAGTRPVDGTGGSPSVTTSISSTAPLADSNSFLLTKDAVNRQGQGWSIPFTIPNSMKAKVAQIELDYIVNSGTFAAGSSSSDGDLIVYIYDVTNSTLIEPSSIKFLSSSTAISDKIVTNFQTSATGTSYNLILHVASTSASAWELKTDNFVVKPSSYVYGTPITDWVSYTPSNTQGLGTITSVNLKWRRVGDSMQIQGGYTTGTVTGSAAQLGLPSGYTIGGTASTRVYAGETIRNGGSRITNFAIQGATYLTFGGGASSHGDIPGSSAFGSTETLYTTAFDIPITGWSSSTQQSDGYDGRGVVASYTRNANSTVNTTATDIVWNTAIGSLDLTAMMNTSTGVITFPSSGQYEVAISARIDTGGSAATQHVISTVGTGSVPNGLVMAASTDLAASKAYNYYPKITFNARAGDTLKIQATSATNSSTWIGDQSYISIAKLSAPTTISATEKLIASYGDDSGQSITTSNQIIGFNTLTEDTHAIKSGTGTSTQFIIPYQGSFRIFTQLQTGATTSSGNQYFIPKIYIDGSPVAEGGNRFPTSHISPTGTVEWTGPLNAGQIVTIRLDTNVAASRSLSSSATSNRMSIIRIK